MVLRSCSAHPLAHPASTKVRAQPSSHARKAAPPESGKIKNNTALIHGLAVLKGYEHLVDKGHGDIGRDKACSRAGDAEQKTQQEKTGSRAGQS